MGCWIHSALGAGERLWGWCGNRSDRANRSYGGANRRVSEVSQKRGWVIRYFGVCAVVRVWRRGGNENENEEEECGGEGVAGLVFRGPAGDRR